MTQWHREQYKKSRSSKGRIGVKKGEKEQYVESKEQ